MNFFKLDSRGTVLMEFAFVLPFIFMLFVGTVEFSHGLRIREMMSALGRESANQAFRTCGADGSSRVCTPSLSTADACLTRVNLETIGLAQRVIGNITPLRLTLSMYRYDAVSDQVLWLGASRDSSGAAGLSSYTEQRIRNEYLVLIKEHEVLTISEVYYDFSPFFDVSWLRASTFYDATVY